MNKKFLRNKIFISTMVLFVISDVFFIFKKYEQYQTKLVLKDEQIQTIFSEHQQEISKLKNDIDLLRFESDGKMDEVAKKLAEEKKLREAIESQRDVQTKVSQSKITSLEQQLSKTTLLPSLTNIIKSWEPLVVYIECRFDTLSTFYSYKSMGSGVIIKLNNSPIKVLTNRHVILGNRRYQVKSCVITSPEKNLNIEIQNTDIEISNSNDDWGILTVNNPSDYLKSITALPINICDQKPILGDEIAVLGYPTIGSKTGVTATNGIVSGFDGNYFITSAKVDEGNSGGAAILQKNNCLLGIPTYASLGEVESFARILDIWKIFIK